MIGCINKQSMSFVMLIIRNSSNRPLHLHFFLHYSSGEGGGLFFIIYSFLLGLVLSQVIFFYKQKSFKSREIGSFFHIKTLFKSRRTKTHSIVWNTKFHHPTTRCALRKSGNIDLQIFNRFCLCKAMRSTADFNMCLFRGH